MDSILETKKRLNLAQQISATLEGKVKGVMLAGSMGFGQNYSITDKSDIDLVVVMEKERIDQLLKNPYLQGKISDETAELFQKEKINCFWVTQEIRGVETNIFVYEKNGYANFCLLEGALKTFKKDRPSADTQTGYGFDGEPITIDRHVTPVAQGFIYEKPALVDGKYWGGVPRQDFFYSGVPLYQEDSFFSKAESAVWVATVKQLIKEHGSTPDLNKVNILNTHYTYQTQRERLPRSVVDAIQERTKTELRARDEAITESGCATLIYGAAAALNFGLAVHNEDWKKFAFFVVGATLFSIPAAQYFKQYRFLK